MTCLTNFLRKVKCQNYRNIAQHEPHIPRLDKFEIPNFQITLWIKASIFKVLYLATRLDQVQSKRSILQVTLTETAKSLVRLLLTTYHRAEPPPMKIQFETYRQNLQQETLLLVDLICHIVVQAKCYEHSLIL